MSSTDWRTTTTLLEDLQSSPASSAWDRLCRRFRTPVVRFAGRMGLSPSDAEDVAQETFVAFSIAFRGGRYRRADGRLSGWLFGIALRQSLNTRRRNLARERHVEPAARADYWISAPDRRAAQEAWEQEWNRTVLNKCLKRARLEFSDQMFRCFDLVVLDGRSPEEAAQALNSTVKSVYNAKHRILKRVREMRVAYERFDGMDDGTRALR
ncbi:MAG: sigma-70 family RNA polymerase sigma factor [Phycisphaerales bacterium]|nr:sigma-70 family RNA polymerase sigma factor [Phycisphaerales bacterium]